LTWAHPTLPDRPEEPRRPEGTEFRLPWLGGTLSSVGDALVPVATAFAALEIGDATDSGSSSRRRWGRKPSSSWSADSGPTAAPIEAEGSATPAPPLHVP